MAQIPSALQQLHDPLFEEKGVEVFVKRDDQIHPHVMGNKWRKLKYNIIHARETGYNGLLTIGGAYSNHIAATAAACKENGFRSIGIIRGDELHGQSNATLRFASSCGMKLIFVSRAEFRQIKENFEDLQEQYDSFYCLPEGGTNLLAIQGCEEIVKEIDIPYDFITCSLGTGGTMAGILRGMQGQKKIIGFSALKGDFVHEEFKKLLHGANISYSNYLLETRFHFGGYGRVTSELVNFINKTIVENNMVFDPIYTGKMYFGLKTRIREGGFARGMRIIVVHSGGLQGIDGFNERTKTPIFLT